MHIIGSTSPTQLYCLEHYTLELQGGKYFEEDANSIMLRAGTQEVYMNVTWATRQVRCYLSNAQDAGTWDKSQQLEGVAKLAAFMTDHEIHFNGAGEEHLPTVTQAWSLSHTDPDKMRLNRETIAGLAAILREYTKLTIKVHGETGAANYAPRPLAEHLGLHYTNDVQEIMDQLARRRAQACIDALIAQSVPEEQLTISYKGRGGQTTIAFLPHGIDSSVPTDPNKANDQLEVQKAKAAQNPLRASHTSCA